MLTDNGTYFTTSGADGAAIPLVTVEPEMFKLDPIPRMPGLTS